MRQLLIAAALAVATAACAPLPTTVEVTLKHSRFAPATIDVPVGVPVTFVMRNLDPIDHEWIIGAPDLHARHRTGTEPVHDTVPTEVTVPALETRTTTVTFERPGLLAVICHLPRHEEYGMVGAVRVR
ncbi:MAG: cupredoxin domain-containing protein [Candidatus Limnocylindria bacterium]